MAALIYDSLLLVKDSVVGRTLSWRTKRWLNFRRDVWGFDRGSLDLASAAQIKVAMCRAWQFAEVHVRRFPELNFARPSWVVKPTNFNWLPPTKTLAEGLGVGLNIDSKSSEESGNEKEEESESESGNEDQSSVEEEEADDEASSQEEQDSSKKSPYRGVSWSQGKWVASIGHRGSTHYLGRYIDELAAARAYDMAARRRHKEQARLNFPLAHASSVQRSSDEDEDNDEPASGVDASDSSEEEESDSEEDDEASKSRFRGVRRKGLRWQAQMTHSGKCHYLGTFDDEEEAARAFDAAARQHRGDHAEVNFSADKDEDSSEDDDEEEAPAEGNESEENDDSDSAEHPRSEREEAAGRAQRHTKGKTSVYRGVSWSKRCQKWRVVIRHSGSQHGVGSFTDELMAAQAYDAAARQHHKERAQLNFPAAGSSSREEESDSSEDDSSSDDPESSEERAHLDSPTVSAAQSRKRPGQALTHAVAKRRNPRRSNFAQGRWSSAEHEAFLRGLQTHGRDWGKIAQLVRSRTPQQCQKHTRLVGLREGGFAPSAASRQQQQEQRPQLQNSRQFPCRQQRQQQQQPRQQRQWRLHRQCQDSRHTRQHKRKRGGEDVAQQMRASSEQMEPCCTVCGAAGRRHKWYVSA